MLFRQILMDTGVMKIRTTTIQNTVRTVRTASTQTHTRRTMTLKRTKRLKRTKLTRRARKYRLKFSTLDEKTLFWTTPIIQKIMNTNCPNNETSIPDFILINPFLNSVLPILQFIMIYSLFYHCVMCMQ